MEQVYEFEAIVCFDESPDSGPMNYYIEVPAEVADALKGHRVEGTILGARFRRTLHDGPGTTTRVRFSKAWLTSRSIEVGGRHTVALYRDPTPVRKTPTSADQTDH